MSVCVSAHVHQENLAFLKALAPLIFFALPFISFLCLLATYFPEKVIKSQGRAVLELSFNRGLSGGVQDAWYLILYYAWLTAESMRKNSLG